METAGDHEVEDQPKIAFEADGDALAYAAQAANLFVVRGGERRVDGAEKERARQADALERLAHNARLHDAIKVTLLYWVDRLRARAAGDFPEKVTAFREGMAVHGRYGQPCPNCGAKVQRIRYASNETNYCARCQTGGRLLADRALSRLLREDWPRTLEELETLPRRAILKSSPEP